MKPFEIDVEKVHGAEVKGILIEISGTMTVRKLGEPGNGFQSTICLELEQALKLLEALTGAVKTALGHRSP